MTETEAGAAPNPSSMSLLHGSIRFLLELVMLGALALWGWTLGDGGITGVLLAALFVLLAAGLWGVFGTPNDGSRGKPVISTPGPVRLLIEVVVIGLASYALWTCWSRAAAETFMTVIAIHYALAWERTRWLLTGRT